MAKRFSRLKYALSTLRTPLGSGVIPDAPAGTIARKYQDYQAGKVKLTYTRTNDSKPEAILRVSILPFHFGGVAGTEAIVAQSARASLATAPNEVQTACNQIVVNPELHSKLDRFKPARVTVFDYSETKAPETSQITGLAYEKRVGKSYTFPYGASATEKTDSAVRKAILVAVKAIGTASASFSSEKY
jgi:hypothetical protein